MSSNQSRNNSKAVIAIPQKQEIVPFRNTPLYKLLELRKKRVEAIYREQTRLINREINAASEQYRAEHSHCWDEVCKKTDAWEAEVEARIIYKGEMDDSDYEEEDDGVAVEIMLKDGVEYLVEETGNVYDIKEWCENEKMVKVGRHTYQHGIILD